MRMETLLVHAAVAPDFLPLVAARLARGRRGDCAADERTRALMPAARPAEPADWDTEYLDYILAVRVVDGLRRRGRPYPAARLRARRGHRHRDLRCARRFTHEVDAAAVLVNASTRLVDGSQFGMGAEMGISTSSVHARGPVGVRELTTSKFVVIGDGQIRE